MLGCLGYRFIKMTFWSGLNIEWTQPYYMISEDPETISNEKERDGFDMPFHLKYLIQGIYFGGYLIWLIHLVFSYLSTRMITLNTMQRIDVCMMHFCPTQSNEF